METAFNREMYTGYALLWSGSMGGETGAECVVPDSMPDVGAILDADGVLCIRSKDCSNGELRASAELSVKVLYQPDDGGALRSLSLVMNTELQTAVPDADMDCLGLVSLRVRALDARAQNSRKISVRAELTGSAQCYKKEERSFIRGVAQSELALETLEREAEVFMVSDVREKTFVISDDYSLPSGLETVDGILSQRVQLLEGESEFAGGKLVFRGRARVFLLLTAGDVAYPCSYETEFSQILEADGETEPAPEIQLTLTGVYFDLPERSGGKLAAELHVLAQVVCMRKIDVCYLADAYSNRCAVEVKTESCRCSCSVRDIQLRRTITDTVELPQDAAELLFLRAGAMSAAVEAAGVAVSLPLRAVYRRRDGGCGSMSIRLQDTLETDVCDGESLALLSCAAADAFCSLSPGSLDLRVPIELRLRAVKQTTLVQLEELRACADALPELPSLTLLQSGGPADLWRLAKTHRSTRAAILAANDGKTEGLLLIPKCR